MRQILSILLLTSAALCASAQTYSQPVRDVNDPTRNPFTASCQMTWQGVPGTGGCQLATVPAGKRLAVRDASFVCSVHSAANISYGYLASYSGGFVILAMEDATPAFAGTRAKVAARTVFMSTEAGTLLAQAILTGNVAASPNCSVSIQGYLVDAN
ncbi:MAG: hypothetical protein ABI972_21365 [Acidobacteriota bacterium]